MVKRYIDVFGNQSFLLFLYDIRFHSGAKNSL